MASAIRYPINAVVFAGLAYGQAGKDSDERRKAILDAADGAALRR